MRTGRAAAVDDAVYTLQVSCAFTVGSPVVDVAMGNFLACLDGGSDDERCAERVGVKAVDSIRCAANASP